MDFLFRLRPVPNTPHPIENSLGGSIHRNYDLRHRLHIVGEFQLLVHHCLRALLSIRKEYLTRVISHPQALAQCELTLIGMGLNVARDAFDDSAGAAEYVATNGLRDTATIASAWATELRKKNETRPAIKTMEKSTPGGETHEDLTRPPSPCLLLSATSSPSYPPFPSPQRRNHLCFILPQPIFHGGGSRGTERTHSSQFSILPRRQCQRAEL